MPRIFIVSNIPKFLFGHYSINFMPERPACLLAQAAVANLPTCLPHTGHGATQHHTTIELDITAGLITVGF